ncbi:MAG: hypothetical protein K0S63_406 [Gammaproteobacteria bacterium]|jgi:uncharacterized protein (DUF4415 family)|nr:hypothetical protein [Gammaproteobacteria bacterium]
MQKDIEALKKRKIDLSEEESAEITSWEKSVRGKFYRPIKKQITIRMDADVLDWFKHTAGKYQTLINEACKKYIAHHEKLHKSSKESKRKQA